MIRVLFVVPHPIEGPSPRFRVYQFLPYLREHGVAAEVRPFFTSREAQVIYNARGVAPKLAYTLAASARRLGDLVRASRYDIVYVLREAFPFGPEIIELALTAASGRLVLDFDDAIWLPSISYPNPLDGLRHWSKPIRLMRRAHAVVAGSDYLADFARSQVERPDRVHVVPTAVDTDCYCPLTKPASPRVTVGWVGTPRGSTYLLKPLLPVVEALAERYSSVDWLFVGAEPFPVGNLPVRFKTWALDQAISDIQSFDIGIMPLTDDPETRGKCGFKLVQYMSCGIPCVCSPVGANRTIVEEGIQGFFATDPAAWYGRLEHLIQDEGARRRMGEMGRARACTRFSLAVQAPRLRAILTAVAQEPPRRSLFATTPDCAR